MTTSTPDLQELLAPGQESIANEFLEELEQGQGQPSEPHPLDHALEGMQGEQPEQLLAGKFKTPQELEKAYLEAQKLIGQRGQQPPADEPAGPTPEQYTPELGKQLYGDTVSSAIEAAAINPLEMAEKVYAGQDVSSYVDALVEKGGLPRDLVQTYLEGGAARCCCACACCWPAQRGGCGRDQGGRWRRPRVCADQPVGSGQPGSAGPGRLQRRR